MIALLLALLVAQDVFVPPVPKGIAHDGVVRTPKQALRLPAEKERWVRVRSPHFDVISSLGDSRTRTIAHDLEVLTSALTHHNARFSRSPVPTRVFVFARRAESQGYFDLLLQRERSAATGLFIHHHGGGVMIVDGRSWRSDRTAMHELVHDLLADSDTHPPLWLEEGLAEYFSIADVRGQTAIVGQPIPNAAIYLRKRGTMPVETMLGMRGSDADAQSTRFYAQSWMAVALLMRRDREAFYRFERELENGADAADGLQRNFGMTLRDFEAAIRALSTSEPIRIVVRDDDPQIDSAPLDRATLLYELGAFLAIVEGAEKEAARHFDAALALNPRHARTLAALQRFDEALQADPTDAEIRLKYAEWLMRDAIGPFAGVFEHGDLAPFRKARALAEEALKLGADDGRARGDLGVSFIVEDDPAPGIEQLRRAVDLLPRRDDFALHLYALLLRAGQREAADALFAARFENARDKQTAFAARNVLLRVETDRANALSRAGKLAEAAAVVRKLAAATPDPRGRAELEQQAATLEATAEINRQIAIYNDAVADMNAGRRGDARRKLDELLKIARDEKLLADARKLRGEL